MKRDMDLVRDIMLAVEASDKNPLGWVELDHLGRPESEIGYHVVLMEEAGLIEARELNTMARYLSLPKRLTWRGHEFLDAIREPEVWRRTKGGLAKVGNASIEFVFRQSLRQEAGKRAAGGRSSLAGRGRLDARADVVGTGRARTRQHAGGCARCHDGGYCRLRQVNHRTTGRHRCGPRALLDWLTERHGSWQQGRVLARTGAAD